VVILRETFYYYFPKRNIVLRKGKEINRDSESNGEWNQISLTILVKYLILFLKLNIIESLFKKEEHFKLKFKIPQKVTVL